MSSPAVSLAWTATGWAPEAGFDCPDGVLPIEIQVTTGGLTRRAVVDLYQELCYNQTGTVSSSARLRPVWSSTGDHGLLLVDAGSATFGFHSYRFLPLATSGATVEVVSKGLSADALAKQVAALWEAGFVVVGTGPARSARSTHQVYANPAHLAEASRLATLLGAGPPEPLSWSANADVVVALAP